MNINESFGYVINLTARNIKKNLEQKIRSYDITTSQWSVIKLLSEEDGLTQADVAEKLSSDRATAGAVIEKLISKNLVYKKQNENDRRAYMVFISDHGRQLAKDISLEAIRANSEALSGFTDDEVKELMNFLYRVRDNLNRE